MYHNHVDSVEALRSVEPAECNKHKFQNAIFGYRESDPMQWFGASSGRAAMDLCDHGWPEGVVKLNNFKRKLTKDLPRAKRMKRKKMRGAQGNELDIHRVYAGNLDKAWTTSHKVEADAHKQGKKVQLVVNICCNADKRANQFFWRGACAYYLTDALLKAGYSVEVIAMMEAHRQYNDNETSVHTITVKHYDQRINVENLATVFCLSGFFRTYGWKFIASRDKKVSSGWGHATYSMPKIDMFTSAKRATYRFYIDDVWTELDAIEFINNVELIK